jgi:colicin import membrane protein
LQFGLFISVLLHAAILGWTLISIHSQRQLIAPEPEPVAVGMIAPGEVTKVRLGSRTAKLLEAEAKESPKGEAAKKEAPKAKMAAAAAPPPPPPPPPEKTPDPIAQKLAEPLPTPTPPPPAPPAEAQKKLEAEQQERERQAAEKLKAEELRKVEEQKQADEAVRAAEEQKRVEEQKRLDEQKRAEEQKKAEEQKRLEEERRQAELKKKREEEKKRREAALKKKREEEKKRQEAEAAKQKQFNADKIAALLNKAPDAAPPPPSAPPDQPTKNKGPALGAQEGRDKQISASEMAVLKGRIQSRLRACWRLPSGGGGSDTPPVTLRWHLKPDGSLDGEPQVEQARADPLFRLAAEAALRAVRECAPFDLPPERYGVWRVIIWDFDPSQML